jgi:outer membrane receptor protein involved in Fe transport
MKNSLTLLACALALAPSLPAQTAPTPSPTAAAGEGPLKLEAFTVTGTNIRRMEVETALPVTVFSQSEIDIRDASQPSELLTALPQVTGLPGNETATLGATARGDNASVSLRGTNSGDTLLLLNGRRLPPHPISQNENATPALPVNVNQMPNRGLERVDVLRDGASSVYGTDAIAGVVNYVMRRNFTGTELMLRYGQTRYRDGQERRATLTHGLSFAGGKGRALLVADFFSREAMYVRDRPFAADADNSTRAPAPWNVATDTTFNLRSVTSEYGSFTLGTTSGTGVFTPGRTAGLPANQVNTNGNFFLAPNGGGGVQFLTATPSRAGVTREYYWNNNTYRVIQPQTERTNVFLSSEFDVSDRVTVFGDFNMYLAASSTVREPDGITASTDGNIVVPATNPWNPFGTRFVSPTGAPNADGTPRLTGTPAAVLLNNKRLKDLALRAADVDTAVYRGVLGARGKLANSWTWEAASLYGEARTTDFENGATRKTKIISAINQTDPALAFNPFSRTFAVRGDQIVVTGDYQNPESVQRTFREPFVREGITKLGSLDARASGNLLRIWGGNAIAAAVGTEFRYEAYDDYRPPYAGLNPLGSGLPLDSNDFLGFSPNSDTHGNRHVTALYAETVIPLVGPRQQLPLVQSLELTGAARFESYTDFGETTKPKVGVAWRPIRSVMVRGSYNEGFRAPNLAQLFTGTLIRTVTNSTDSYRNTVTGLPSDGPSNRRNIASGNPDLQPQTSTGKSVGIVVDVPGVRGLSVAVDYFEISQRNVVAASGSINDDRDALLAATQAALAAGQNIGAIDLGSGTDAYKGDPSVVRLPVTQADRDFFAAYNARQPANSQRAVVGAIQNIRTTYFNRGLEYTNGFDFDVNYRLPQNALGRFTLNTSATYVMNYYRYQRVGADKFNSRGTNSFGGALPKWRGSATVSWRRNAWNAGLGAYYIGEYLDSGAAASAAQYEALGRPSYIGSIVNSGVRFYRFIVEDTMTYNAYVGYRVDSRNRWLNGTAIRLGVNNLTDEKPPLSSDSRGYDPAVYNTLARGLSWNLQITKKL